jgi:hypothetical protein
MNLQRSSAAAPPTRAAATRNAAAIVQPKHSAVDEQRGPGAALSKT